MKDEVHISGLAKDIARYYLQNPTVADTVEGLLRWRLEEERVIRTLQDVQNALRWLVAEGYLTIRSQGNRTIFRLNQDRIEELKSELEFRA